MGGHVAPYRPVNWFFLALSNAVSSCFGEQSLVMMDDPKIADGESQPIPKRHLHCTYIFQSAVPECVCFDAGWM